MDTVGEESDDSANYQPGPPPGDGQQPQGEDKEEEDEGGAEEEAPKDFEEVMKELEGAGAASEVLDRVVKLLESQRLQTQRLLYQEEERRTTKDMVNKVLGTMLLGRSSILKLTCLRINIYDSYDFIRFIRRIWQALAGLSDFSYCCSAV